MVFWDFKTPALTDASSTKLLSLKSSKLFLKSDTDILNLSAPGAE